MVAIEGTNTGGEAGLIGSFNNGLVTDETWRCANALVPGWNKPEFDDSSWPKAMPTGRKLHIQGPPIAEQAKWIWTSNPAGDLKLYCRSKLGG